MLNSHYIQALLGIKDAIITKVEKNSKDLIIEVWFTMERKIHLCPCCNEWTDVVHDYRTQTIKGSPLGAYAILFHYRKRRYVCSHCNKRFYEENSFVPRYYRMTSDLIAFIINELKSTHSITDIAKRCNVSPFTVNRLFHYISPKPVKLPEVLSIDEFKGNAETGKYQCILTDPKNHTVLDILPGRESHLLSSYFSSFSRDERLKVKVVVIDMWKPYKELAQIYFKNAIVVIDRFHFIRQVLWAFDKIRKEEQKRFSKQRRTYFKRSKALLWARFNKLDDEGKLAANLMLSASERLLKAHSLKEKFLDFVDASSFEEAKERLSTWYLYVNAYQLPEFNNCLQTIARWQDNILNSFKVPYTNGFTEGVNNKIKVLKRNAYGIRNFKRFRARILYMMSR